GRQRLTSWLFRPESRLSPAISKSTGRHSREEHLYAYCLRQRTNMRQIGRRVAIGSLSLRTRLSSSAIFGSLAPWQARGIALPLIISVTQGFLPFNQMASDWPT